MERLLYSSVATEGLSTQEVFRIIETSQRNNVRREVTGFLIHDSDRFLQLIEGPPLAVEGLLADIERDPRNHSVEVILRSSAEERWFPDWDMKRLISFGSVPAQEELREILRDKAGGSEILAAVNRFLGV